MELTEFLLARIAEDEEVARRPLPAHWPYEAYGDRMGGRIRGICEDWQGRAFRPVSEHIARWDPAHVLAECAVKRAIVESCRPAGDMSHVLTEMASDSTVDPKALAEATPLALVAEHMTQQALNDVLRLLAFAYARHPDYRQEWSPLTRTPTAS